MTKFLTILLAFGLAIIPTFAAEDHGDLPTPAAVKAQIEEAHGGTIDCEKVTNTEFELAGEAWMETQHPGTQHELMDNMMGGEGSASLLSAHIAMGRSYLGCGTATDFGGGMMGGFGGGMMSDQLLPGDPGPTDAGTSWLAGSGMMGGDWSGHTIANNGWMHAGSGLLGMGSGWLLGGLLIGGLVHVALWVAFIALTVWVAKKVWYGTAKASSTRKK